MSMRGKVRIVNTAQLEPTPLPTAQDRIKEMLGYD